MTPVLSAARLEAMLSWLASALRLQRGGRFRIYRPRHFVAAWITGRN